MIPRPHIFSGNIQHDLCAMRRVVALIVLVGVMSMSPLAAASSHFVTEAKGPPGDIEYISTSSGDTGLLVTDNGISLEGSSVGLGLAPSAIYWFGNHDAPMESFGFSFSHSVEGTPEITVRFDGMNMIDTDIDNIVFTVYDDQGIIMGAVSENERQVTFNGGSPGRTFYVVVLIDTHGLSPDDAIHGVFSVTV